MSLGSNQNFYLALATLTGTVIGAGIFGIPYVIEKSGILPGFFYFLVLGGAVLMVLLFFGEIVLSTREKHRLVGFVRKYLGKRGRIFITLSTIAGTIGTLLAYIILGGDFLKMVFSSFSELSAFYFSLIFWAILSFFIIRGIKLIALAEFLMNIIFLLAVLLIIAFALPQAQLENFDLINKSGLFLPYGVILFSLIGLPAIPAMGEILKEGREKAQFKKVIIVALLLVIALYILFAAAVIGVSGKATSPEALQGLLPFLGEKIVIIGALFGIFAVATSFLVMGNYLKNTLFYDYKIPRTVSALLACGAPLCLFLLGFRSFIETIGLVGTIIGAIEGIVIILIFKKVKELRDRQPEYSLKVSSFVLYLLMAIFIIGAVSQIYSFV